MNKNFFVQVLCLFTVISVTLGLNKDNLREIQLSSLTNEHRRSLLSTNACEKDTRILDENSSLTSQFQLILTNFTDSIADHFDSYCKSVRNKDHVSTECVIDYSTFSAADAYQSQCETEGGVDYPMSFMMHCLRPKLDGSTATVEMNLMNIPRCVGVSCDAEHLYSTTLLQVINDIQGSFGHDGDWKCHFFHDFEALQSAPGRTIELPTNAPNKQSPDGIIDEGEEGEVESAGMTISQHGKLFSTVLVVGSFTLFFH